MTKTLSSYLSLASIYRYGYSVKSVVKLEVIEVYVLVFINSRVYTLTNGLTVYYPLIFHR